MWEQIKIFNLTTIIEFSVWLGEAGWMMRINDSLAIYSIGVNGVKKQYQRLAKAMEGSIL